MATLISLTRHGESEHNLRTAHYQGRAPASHRMRMADFSQWFHLVVRPKQEGEASA